ncbi:MAG: O-antigen ligase family protein, partial [Acidobacteriia bacterium]|nr:O-antigen ligase family protein [Terriglobia bacterium]
PVATRVYRVRTAGAPKARALARVAFSLLWIFVFTIAWENIVVIPGIGTVGKLAGALAFGVGLLAVVDQGRARGLTAVHVWLALFVLWGGFTYLWSVSPERTQSEVLTYIQLLGMIWILREVAFRKESQRSLMSAYVLGTYVSSIATFMAFLSGTAVYYNRYTAQGFNPGDLGLMLALSIPFGLHLAATERNKLLVCVYRLHCVAALSAILFTAARGALIAALISLTMVPLSFMKWSSRQRFAVGFTGLTAAVVILCVVPASSWTRLSTIGQEVSEGTLNERKTIWSAGLEVLSQHPVQGIGLDAFAPAVQRILYTPRQQNTLDGRREVIELVAHNTFLSVLVEAGVIGFGLFLAALIALWKGAFTLEAAERNLWLVVLSVWTVGVMELTWEYRKPTWLIFGLLAAAIGAAKSKQAVSPRMYLLAPGSAICR